MRGSLWIERRAARWSKSGAAPMYLAAACLGVLAGVLVTHARLHLGLPGHKALLWMAPVLAGRFVWPCRASCSTAALTTAITTMLLGGQLAGGLLMLPLIVAAGAGLDLAALLVQRWGVRAWAGVPLFALAGGAGNLVCLVKRLFSPMQPAGVLWGLGPLWTLAVSYAMFGLLAGAIGALAGYGVLALRKKRP